MPATPEDIDRISRHTLALCEAGKVRESVPYCIDALDEVLSDAQLRLLLKHRATLHTVLRSGLEAIARDRGMVVDGN